MRVGTWAPTEGTGPRVGRSPASVPPTPPAQGLPGPSGEKGETGDVGPMVSVNPLTVCDPDWPRPLLLVTPQHSAQPSTHCYCPPPPPLPGLAAPAPCSGSLPGPAPPPHSCTPVAVSLTSLPCLRVDLFLPRDHLAPQDLEAQLDPMEPM